MMKSLAAKKLRELLTSGQFQALFELLIDMLRGRQIASGAAKQGQVKGLSKVLASAHVPEGFNPKKWEIVQVETPSIILGDGCVVAVSDDGGIGSPLKISSSWCEAYLPISPRQIVVAIKESGSPRLSPSEVNEASAGIASKYLYASKSGDSLSNLVPKIGSVPILSPEEVADIVSKALE